MKSSFPRLAGALLLGFLCACREPASVTPPAPVNAPTLSGNGLTGYLTAAANGGAPPADYTYGFSFYTEVSTLNPQSAAGTQLGWGTWLIPDNRTFTQALCPVGTYARDHWPDRGPTYADVYQTIEGGAGAWVSEAFPTAGPKFRINGTADCYSHQIASPGWEFGPQALPSEMLGLAQLSNRFLVAPDGVVFGGTSPGVLGYAWMALPLIAAYTSPPGVATGDQSWTLFLRASNFTGPVAFYTPEIWSQVNDSDPTGTGRGLDAQPALNGGAALEIGGTPMFTSHDRNGVAYARIPRLTFAAEPAGSATYGAVLLDDIHYYSKQAIWDAVAAGIQDSTAPSGFTPSGAMAPALSGPGTGLRLGGDPVTTTSFFAAVLNTGSGSGAFALGWRDSLEPGVIPEYYRRSGGSWVPVPGAQVPTETGLAQATFPRAQSGSFPAVDTSSGAPWDASRWAAGPFTVTLRDGSTVEYVWYRFVDQPAIARLGLGPGVLQQLQAFVAAWQAASDLAGITIAPPALGALVSLDAAQFVTPPAGLETGYVPIAIRQY